MKAYWIESIMMIVIGGFLIYYARPDGFWWYVDFQHLVESALFIMGLCLVSIGGVSLLVLLITWGDDE